jgi:hypothetical protein
MGCCQGAGCPEQCLGQRRRPALLPLEHLELMHRGRAPREHRPQKRERSLECSEPLVALLQQVQP